MPPAVSGQPATTPSRQAEKSAAMRQRIIDAATARLAATGYHRTSIAEIVKQGGFSPGALQHHFPTREALMAAVARHLLARSIRWFKRTTETPATTRDDFAAFIHSSWRAQFSSPDYAALLEIMTAARTDEGLRAQIAPELAAWGETFEQEVGAFVSATGGDVTHLSALMALSRCMMTGLLVHDALLDQDERINDIIETWIDLFYAAAR